MAILLACAVSTVAACSSEPATSGVDPSKRGGFTDEEIEALCRFQSDLLNDSECIVEDHPYPDYEGCLEHPPPIGGCGFPDVGAYEECIRAQAAGDCESTSCLITLCL